MNRFLLMIGGKALYSQRPCHSSHKVHLPSSTLIKFPKFVKGLIYNQYSRAVPLAYLIVYLYSVTVELQHFRGFSPTLKPLGLVTFQLVATTPHWFGSHLDRASALNLANPLPLLIFFGVFWCVFFQFGNGLVVGYWSKHSILHSSTLGIS